MFRTKKLVDKHCHSCPFAKSAHLLGDTVVLFILRELSHEEKSFSELESLLAFVSSSTLSKKLKELKEKGIIVRREEPGKPPRVFYSLSKKASLFTEIESSLVAFGNEAFPSH